LVYTNFIGYFHKISYFCGFKFQCRYYANGIYIFRFEVYVLQYDHEPVHIHVVKGKGKVKEYAIYQVVPDIVLLENKGLKSNELKMAEMVIEENKEIIIENWNLFFGKKIEQ
jgi:hypothetical protein